MTYYCQIADKHGAINHCSHTCLKQCEACKPNHPVPALLVDSVSDLGERWSNWMDHPDMDHRW